MSTRPNRLEHPVDQPPHLGFVGEIGHLAMGVPVPQLLGSFAEAIGGRGDRHRCALAGEEPGGREPDALGATRARHERDASIEPAHCRAHASGVPRSGVELRGDIAQVAVAHVEDDTPATMTDVASGGKRY
jgi:hypothetical protein